MSRMADIINLRRARKVRDRAARGAAAAENRRAFGRSKAETELTEAAAAQAARRLDGHKRDLPPDDA